MPPPILNSSLLSADGDASGNDINEYNNINESF